MNQLISHVYSGTLYTSSNIPLILLVPISIVHLIVCFALMGVLSSDFLASNINSLCDSSGILVTILLSFCNSSPDIISNFVAWTSSKTVQENTDFLAFSEVLGACGTIICVAQGLVFITIARIVRKKIFTTEAADPDDDGSPIDVENNSEEELNKTVRHMLKKILVDLLFFAAAMCLMLICVFTRRISAFSCFAMLFLYGAYLFYNYKQHKLSEHETRENITQQGASIQLDDYNANDMGSLYDITMEEDIVRYNYTHNPNYIESIDYSVFLNLLEGSDPNVAESPENILPTDSNVNNKSKDHISKNGEDTTRPFSAPELSTVTNPEGYVDDSRRSISEPATSRPYSDFEPENTRDLSNLQEGTKQQKPILLMHNQVKEYTKVTLKPHVGARKSSGPTKNNLSDSLQSIINWEQEFRVFLKIFAIFGVVNSLLWIVILANNLIGIIEYYQEITHISESILGLTFFAWGNSIADILSNLAILKLYNTKMDSTNGDHANKKLTSLLKFAAISIGSLHEIPQVSNFPESSSA
ncbi:hypothetical protein ACO0QE_000053 [Hanseniaspora vineae]